MSFSFQENSLSDYSNVREQILSQGRAKYGASGYTHIVFTNGCFDILHRGHLSLLDYCRSLAGERGAVVVGMNSDASVKMIKGPSRPIQDEKTRASLLASLRYVDVVVTFDEQTPLELIKSLSPEVLVKGGDYRLDEIVGSEFAFETTLAPVVDGESTSAIIERIKRS